MAGTVALIVAAGRGMRAGGGIPKQYRDVAGEPVLRHTVRAFLEHRAVDAVRVVIHPDDRGLYDAATAGLPVLDPVHGGETRQQSVALGLQSLKDLSPERVLIQDGARPLTDAATIGRVLKALESHPGAIAALPASDTIKRTGADGTGADVPPLITETVPRETLWRAQTPQGFVFAAILDAHDRAGGRELTDDAAVAEAAGLAVALVRGSDRNIKITTPDDFQFAERLMTESRPSPAPDATPQWESRTGLGFDVHAFEPGNAVILGGVEIDHDAKLKGHSDADVGLHALTDALFGAMVDGDIGQHFPPSDPQWKGAASDQFLIYAVERLRARGGRLVHLDLTLICERPKIGPHRDAIARRIADIVGVTPDRVSVKATTTEQLGFTGRREGIAAQAAVTIELPRSYG
ncbi:MAG: bifunctional 2-C-methyl-D-erythritol 4-phosphate cytidylyltransferase/2-C-methyl-D-erythritol 2,4-cyclodiphosphate synthase [Alphaproteobacteria bacterium]